MTKQIKFLTFPGRKGKSVFRNFISSLGVASLTPRAKDVFVCTDMTQCGQYKDKLEACSNTTCIQMNGSTVRQLLIDDGYLDYLIG